MNIEMNVEDFYNSITARFSSNDNNPDLIVSSPHVDLPVKEDFSYDYPEFYPSQEQIDEICEGPTKINCIGNVVY
jgi:hypothetical protein